MSYKSNDAARENRIKSMTETRADDGDSAPMARSKRMEGRKKVSDTFVIDLDKVVGDPNQPRKEFDEDDLDRLAESLKARGQLQPIRVRWDEAIEKYVVIVGERRLRASKRAGLTTIFAVDATSGVSEDDLLEDQLVENCVRVDLKPVEQARAFESLMKSRGFTQKELAAKLNISQTTVSQALSLLKLDVTVQEKVDREEIPPSTAYHIARAKDPVEQVRLAEQAIAGNLDRDEAKAIVQTSNTVGARSRTGGKKFIEVNGGKITVALKDEDADLHDMLAALRDAVKKVQREIEKQAKDAA